MHPLLAQALEIGARADGLTDGRGSRVAVEEREGVLCAQVHGPRGTAAGSAWRWPPMKSRPSRLPPDLPFLPGLSGVAVRDPSGLTAVWPAPPSPPLPGMFGGGPQGPGGGWSGGMPGGRAAAPDPLAAGAHYAAEGAVDRSANRLRQGWAELVRSALSEGWERVGDEVVEGAVDARVVRMRRAGSERSVTFTRSLGVSSLVLLEKSGGGRGGPGGSKRSHPVSSGGDGPPATGDARGA